MRYATFYYDLLRDHVSDLTVHEDKETALKYFNAHFRNYFQLNAQWKADKLPAVYGYPMRTYNGVSARTFKKMFGVSVDEALKIAKGKKLSSEEALEQCKSGREIAKGRRGLNENNSVT